MTLGQWIGQWAGEWFGLAGEVDPNALSGSASISLNASATITAIGAISGAATISFSASGALTTASLPARKRGLGKVSTKDDDDIYPSSAQEQDFIDIMTMVTLSGVLENA